jgi:DUF4097 and DUF4098 domain-containing protein YvlB
MVNRRYRSAAVVFALLMGWVAAPAETQQQTRELSHQFPLTEPVRIEHLAGRIELAPGRGDSITVIARIVAEGRNAEETRRLLEGMAWQESRRGWSLTWPVRGYNAFAYPAEGWLSFGSITTTRFQGQRVRIYGSRRAAAPVLYADLRLEVPPGAWLEVRNAAGGVEGADLSGRLRVDTGRGRVTLEGFDGELDIDTGSGNVVLRDIRGPRAHVDTGSGSVRAEELAVEGVDIDTGSGSVTVTGLQGRHARIDTGSGRVRGENLDLVGLDIDTGSGSVHVSHSLARNLRADTGSGSVTLEDVEVELLVADTGSGSVRIRGDLSAARSILVDTGSGSVLLAGGPGFEFDLRASQGSGTLSVDYDDAELVHGSRGKLVGASRGAARTRVLIDTGSGSATVRP